MGAFRGIVVGLAISIPFWAAVIALVYWRFG